MGDYDMYEAEPQLQAEQRLKLEMQRCERCFNLLKPKEVRSVDFEQCEELQELIPSGERDKARYVYVCRSCTYVKLATTPCIECVNPMSVTEGGAGEDEENHDEDEHEEVDGEGDDYGDGEGDMLSSPADLMELLPDRSFLTRMGDFSDDPTLQRAVRMCPVCRAWEIFVCFQSDFGTSQSALLYYICKKCKNIFRDKKQKKKRSE